jgi:REP element-mobilizing transposase RayT
MVSKGRLGQLTHPVTTRQGAYLPHWTCQGGIYAVTFRLADSLPESILRLWRFEREDIVRTARHLGRDLTVVEQRRLDQLFSEKVDRHLDAGLGECWMRREEIAQIVAGALRHFDETRYELLAWCVMPNHVHVVVRPEKGYELPSILHSWKSFTANKANARIGREGEFWQSEYYDHLIRDDVDLSQQIDYVLNNPRRAGLNGWQWVGRGTGF